MKAEGEKVNKVSASYPNIHIKNFFYAKNGKWHPPPLFLHTVLCVWLDSQFSNERTNQASISIIFMHVLFPYPKALLHITFSSVFMISEQTAFMTKE